jgi:EmrB/QacA subfamily drug resistance transporter
VNRRVSQRVAVSAVYVAAMFISVMDITIVNVALPAIGKDLSANVASVDAVSISYLVSLAVFIPASGWLGDRFGGKRVLLTAIAIFTVASALCGVATTLGQLVAFRVLQGAGGGMLAPVGMAMLFRAFPPAERLRAAGILIGPVIIGPASGPVLGGLLVTHLSWRWVFFVNVPIGIAAVIFGAITLEHNREGEPGHFDLPGFLLTGLGLGLLMFGVSEGPDHGWSSPLVLASIVSGVALLTAAVMVELRVPEPIIALRLLGIELFRLSNILAFLSGAAWLGSLYTITVYFQDGRGLSPLAAGLSTFPESIGVFVGSQLASRWLYRRLGPRRDLAVGLLGVALGMCLMSLMGSGTSLWWARMIMFFMGCSMGQVFTPIQASAFATISPADMGGASTMFNAGRQLGSAVGVAIFATIIALVGPTHGSHDAPDLNAYRAAFLAAAAICLLGLPAALAIRDSDAAGTIPAPRRKSGAVPATQEAIA